MKYLKKIFLCLFISSSLFAASGFEAILNVPVGISLGIDNYKFNKNVDETIKDTLNKSKQMGGVFFDTGVSVQLGYMSQINDIFGISYLFEIGYSYDNFLFKNENNKSEETKWTYHNLQLGLLPKFNIGAFSIGVGGGVKIPLSKKFTSDSSINNDDFLGSVVEDIVSQLIPDVLGYLKLTFDYYIFFSDKSALALGLYLGYDFGAGKESKMNIFDYINKSSFDVGVQVGFRFGPKL